MFLPVVVGRRGVGEVVGRLMRGVTTLMTSFGGSTGTRVRGNGGTTKAHTHGTSLRVRGTVGRFHGMSLRRSGGWFFRWERVQDRAL